MDDNINSDIKSLVEQIFTYLENGTFSDIFRQDKDHDFSNVYSLACDYYDKGLMEQAEKIFRSLCLYDFSNINYLLGLAAVKQVQKQYQKAINLYSLAISLDKNNASAYFYIGQSYLFSGDKTLAMTSFRQCLSMACSDNERKSALAYLSMLEDGQ
ncbi:tetratricopeptide repeat protein [Morganella morganii]|uniref:Tetratricopeptide repeat protein n=1 Tax=Morganella morganii TaxID=582 RepID=A0A9Q4CP79_MORMO|nr:tetratricopeptide repeat protein [Morganella morganii]BEP19658.1 SycD/LcrH family type III secretion system chaperone IpgC [Morganella morganii subsp. sibonii]EGT3624727.1 tetratricopeptide repeat protein [Morganella morganii]EGT3630770.1 tetratricopeptide repeat protein [Morganella morganii]EGT3636243.1 tetratricopeptide repeat protein [Morganella morganii]EJD6037063.1 tetratricopeptide repeat protein [Morganella morganii]